MQATIIIMAAIDGVGVCNADVRTIRGEAERKLKEKGVTSDAVAININSTHCHTVIDIANGKTDTAPKLWHPLQKTFL